MATNKAYHLRTDKWTVRDYLSMAHAAGMDALVAARKRGVSLEEERAAYHEAYNAILPEEKYLALVKRESGFYPEP